jgi:microcystin-dependent protein
MPSTPESNLRLELQATGENATTWGNKTNTNLELLSQAIAGAANVDVGGSGNYTLVASNYASDEARAATLVLTGLLTGNRDVIVPTTPKHYTVLNQTTGAFTLTIRQSAGTGVAIPSGSTLLVCTSTTCVDVGNIPKDGSVTTPKLADTAVTLAKLDFAVTGMVAFFLGNAAPLGWLKINGALLSRTTYAALWAYAQASGNIVTDAAWLAGATGSFSQGDGSTTFRLPDARGEFLRGWDDARGVDSGRSFGSTQSHALQTHNHTVDSYINGALGASGRPQEGTAGNSDTFSTLTSGTTGNFATETRPRNIALLACIKF